MAWVLFWGSIAILAYTLVLFPGLVLLRAAVWRRPHRQADITPSVSVLIAAHNEAGEIADRIENLLALDYPEHLLEVLIASDGSDDGTNDIVRSYADRGIQLLALERSGKIPTLNQAVTAATGEILVFSDANTIFAPDALRALARPFVDPSVGGVAGDQVYLNSGRPGLTSHGETMYWDFDRILKRAQSRSGNVTSATGAIYAMRRSLYRAIPVGVTDDFVASTNVIAQGRRLVFAGDALAYEPVAAGGSTEFGRKVRVITQGLRAVWLMRELLSPWRHGFYAVQLFSHKVLRRLTAIPLLCLLVTSIVLWSEGPWYLAFALGQIVFYTLAAVGLVLGGAPFARRKLFAVPFYISMVNAAAICAVGNTILGRRIERWQPSRPAAKEGPAGEVHALTNPQEASLT